MHQHPKEPDGRWPAGFFFSNLAEDTITPHDDTPVSDPPAALVDGVFALAREGRTGPLGEMIDAGVPIDVTNPRGDSLLIVAVYAQHRATVQELLRRGADTTTVNSSGQTAITCAVFRNDEPILRDLLQADADPELGSHPARAVADQFGLPRMRTVLEEHGRA
jgi:ankyrin repeat protein